MSSNNHPDPASSNMPSGRSSGQQGAGQRRRRPRPPRRRRNRRHSFAVATEDGTGDDREPGPTSNPTTLQTATPGRPGPYVLGQDSFSRSNTSLASEALLDHRDQRARLPRRQSTMEQNSYGPPYSSSRLSRVERPDSAGSPLDRRPMSGRRGSGDAGPEEHDDPADDRTPLLASPQPMRTEPMYDLHPAPHRRDGGVEHAGRRRRPSGDTSVSSRRRRRAGSKQRPRSSFLGEYDVNNPPSVPASPLAGPDMSYEDVMIPKDFNLLDSPQQRAKILSGGGDALIDINEVEADNDGYGGGASPQAPRNAAAEHRKRTMVLTAQEDVCFPHDGLSETAEEDSGTAPSRHDQPSSRRRRRKVWPDLSVLEEWSLEEKEERSEEIRAKKISEPVLVGGRLRPNNHGWHRLEEDAPFRFTYFNEDLPSTIHSQTISELLQPDQTFRDLFIPEPPELTDDEWEDDDDYVLQDRWHEQQQQQQNSHYHQNGRANGESKSATRHPSVASEDDHRQHGSSFDGAGDGDRTPREKPKRYGPRPVFWLDVLSPTDAEMRVIAKAFGIHPLTAEDIMMQEAREKVELFRNYYFVNYRTFEQDGASEDHLDPINMSMVVFREGVISFHFTMIPHPANVRRRIRQLKDYLIPSSDWISYAIIDDITDAFAPLSHQLEEEVDAIEDTILGLHSPPAHGRPHPSPSSKKSEAGDGKTGDGTTGDIGGDLLRRVGDCRKRVMGLYRLLGNKADVIKGFAKRCNEQWEVAPRSEIGLYLGDIQDHIVTMTSNLGHYESILSRAHSNYLAQINIAMNERQEATADVLGKLTVLGTIVLPMNIITGLWGMNCLVPGQDAEGLKWFWGITLCLLGFGFVCYFVAKRVYKIV